MIVLLLAGLTGCKDYTDGKTVHQKLDFTICENRCLPDELLDMIQKKKKEPFKMTYRTKDYMYIIVGYGGCDRTDVSVTVTDLYLSKDAIVVETDLKANGEEQMAGDILSYPYVVIKCELYDRQVMFQQNGRNMEKGVFFYLLCI